MRYADIVVKGSVENIQNLVQRAFEWHGFKVNWNGPNSGKAEKGSIGANVLLGALAQHYSVEFMITPEGQGETLRLHKRGSGLAGGLIGMSRANKLFNTLADTLGSWFNQQGLLLSIKKD